MRVDDARCAFVCDITRRYCYTKHAAGRRPSRHCIEIGRSNIHRPLRSTLWYTTVCQAPHGHDRDSTLVSSTVSLVARLDASSQLCPQRAIIIGSSSALRQYHVASVLPEVPLARRCDSRFRVTRRSRRCKTCVTRCTRGLWPAVV
jgi:hypothetical protein